MNNPADRYITFAGNYTDDAISYSMILETDRLTLETMDMPLLEASFRHDDEAIKALGYTFDPEWPEETFRETIPYFQELCSVSGESDGFGAWVILEKYQRRIVGVAILYGLPESGGDVELGFILNPSQRRKGYCFEAVAVLIPWVLSHSFVGGIFARCQVENTAAKKVLIMLGFIEEGVQNGLLHWSYVQNVSVMFPTKLAEASF